jgi:putative peptidoglycan lipid II flippase
MREQLYQPDMSRLARSALIVAVFFGVEKVLGLMRQLIVNRQFTRAELDTFNVANNLPDLLFAVISGGALAIALIPVLSEQLEKGGRPALWQLFARVANLVFLVTLGLAVLLAIFAEPLVAWEFGLAPGFEPEKQAVVVELMRLNLIATLLFSLAGLVIAGLQANQHFLLPAIAPTMYDLGALFGLLFLAPLQPTQIGPFSLPTLGLGIRGVVYGTILGAALFLLVQVPGLVHYKFRWQPGIRLRSPAMQQVVRLLLPRAFTVLFIQLIFIVTDNLASRLVEGSASALSPAWLYMQVPETLIGTAIGVVLLPTLSEQIALGQRQAFQDALHRAIRVILALALPAAVMLAVVIPPVAGLFSSIDSQLLIWAGRAFLLGLVGHSLLEVAVRAFYAQQNARVPLIAAGLTLAAFILLAVLLYRPLQAAGIGLANSLAFSLEALFLLWLLNRNLPGLLRVSRTLGRASLAALFAGGLALIVFNLLSASLVAAIAALLVGGLAALPLIWPEVKILIRL